MNKYEIWKDKNGLAHGRDCKTGRVFAIGTSVFDNVDKCAHGVRVGDTVYIKYADGHYQNAVDLIIKAARELNDNTVAVRFAYGYTPSNLDLRGDWSVIWTDAIYAIIEQKNNEYYLPLVLCVPKGNLIIKDAESGKCEGETRDEGEKSEG